MSFKATEAILQPDPRFADLCIVEEGSVRRMTLAGHHAALARINLAGLVPMEVRMAFDRARNVMVYAFFDYDLFVVGEVLAFGAFELALKHRLSDHGGVTRGTLRNLVDQARKAAILPPIVRGRQRVADPVEALITLRNGLSHGTSDTHSPGMALNVVSACASWIDHLFPPEP